jgi:phosphopantothenoylcysteine decarboxylase/phosphopantothenate--cysteine ligase
MAEGRRVVLGVTGGVAAYKAAYLARRLIERGYEVRVVMTDSAQEFIGRATFGAITGSDPVTSFFSEAEVSPHTALGQWADVIVIAPATAGSISRLAYGQSSDVLIGTVLASTAPVVVAPAMHTQMWEQPAVEDNVGRLKSFGYTVVEPEVGALAGGDEGVGRLADPETIADAIDAVFPTPDMTGLRVLITAGGTREPIDPVRYLGNHSSGKMGNALAEAASQRGASVVLVTAATPPASSHIEVVTVETAQEMATAVWKRAPSVDIAVMAAAVADFTPHSTHDEKIRRADGIPTIELKATPDVLKGVHEAEPRPFLVGFAAESGSVDAAIEKAASKGVDLLVANDVAKAGSGFGTDTNEVRLVFKDGSIEDLELMSKRAVADAIWDTVLRLRAAS